MCPTDVVNVSAALHDCKRERKEIQKNLQLGFWFEMPFKSSHFAFLEKIRATRLADRHKIASAHVLPDGYEGTADLFGRFA